MTTYGYESLIPAIITILVAITTHRVATALFTGILSASFILAGYIPVKAFGILWHYIVISFSDIERIKISFFLFFVGAMLSVITSSGGYIAFSSWISNYLSTPRKSRVATFLLSLSVFIDDYANVLICGASMRSMSATHRISPALLAYIVDRTATIASVVLVSTWAAYESSLMTASGETVNHILSATEFFFKSLPYHASTYLGLLLVAMAAWQGKWLGAHFDRGDIVVEKKDNKIIGIPIGKLRHLFMPLFTLIALSSIGMVSYSIIGLSNVSHPTIMKVLGDIPTIEILLFSSGIAWIFGIIASRSNRQLSYKKIFGASWSGFLSMVSPAMVIILAKGLSDISAQIGVGTYLSLKISSYVVPQIIPTIIFVISLLITVATGFSWSSMAIVMPIAYNLSVTNQSMQLIPIVSGAVIAGAISGALMVPYSDKTVLTAAAFGISPLYHAKTQFIQALVSALAAVVFFLVLGYKSSYILAAFVSITIVIIVQLVFAKEHYPENIKR